MKKYSKKLSAVLAVGLMAVLAVVPVVLTGCDNDTATVPKPTSYVTVDINPSVELVLDQNQKVLSVKAANADAEVLLYDADGIVGVDVNVAVANIAELAVEMKYVDNGTKSVSVTVASDSVRKAADIYNGVKAKMETEFTKENLTVKVERAVDIVLENELAGVKAANGGKDGYSTLTVEKYRLVKAALRADRHLSMDDAVRMTDAQLTQIVNSAIANADEKLGRAYALLKSEAQFVYDAVKQGVLDASYIETYAMNGDVFDLTPGEYVGLRQAYLNLDHYYNLMHDLFINPVISSGDAVAMLDAVGIPTEETEAFIKELTEDGTVNGKITKDSFAAYLNKTYRNMSDEEKANVKAAYGFVQDKLDGYGASASIATADGKVYIDIAIKALDLNVKAEYNVIDVNSILAKLNEEIDETYAEMERELNGKTHNMNFAKELQASKSEKYAEAERQFNEAMSQYKDAAKKMLEKLQNERKELADRAA